MSKNIDKDIIINASNFLETHLKSDISENYTKMRKILTKIASDTDKSYKYIKTSNLPKQLRHRMYDLAYLNMIYFDIHDMYDTLNNDAELPYETSNEIHANINYIITEVDKCITYINVSINVIKNSNEMNDKKLVDKKLKNIYKAINRIEDSNTEMINIFNKYKPYEGGKHRDSKRQGSIRKRRYIRKHTHKRKHTY